ncbi:MAG TPA: hypothetical protein DCO78_02285, partial [Chitinophagaceae bacterium]|nr:hypothetical protein [Chitinophagaceae bacterium]
MSPGSFASNASDVFQVEGIVKLSLRMVGEAGAFGVVGVKLPPYNSLRISFKPVWKPGCTPVACDGV